MNLNFWKNIAALWSCRNNDEEAIAASEKGKAYGMLLNKQTTVYRDDDFFEYDDDDDEDGI